MKLSICYYDNVINKHNPAEKVYPFVRNLLEWVSCNDTLLVIKTKQNYYTIRYCLECMLKDKAINPRPLWFRIRQFVAAIRGRSPKCRPSIYASYPKDIREMIRDLVWQGKLIFKFKLNDPTWGQAADVVVVMAGGEIIHKLNRDALLYVPERRYFNIFAPAFISRKITYFYEPQDIKGLLDKKYNDINIA